MTNRVRLIPGDCIRAMRLMAQLGIQVDSIVTDPPYHLQSINKRFAAKGRDETSERYAAGCYGRHAKGFMGKKWDGGDITFRRETWELALSVLKPGGHMLAFGGTRGWHRMACAIEDAGFEIRDTVAWLYGSGFPKSHNQAKAIDRHLGAEGETVPVGAPARRLRPGADQNASGEWEKLTDRTYQPGDYVPATPEAAAWQGWGTALKPSHEPIVLARKPLGEKSVAANVLRYGTGAINVDACRVGFASDADHAEAAGKNQHGDFGTGPRQNKIYGEDKRPGVNWDASGRWPANLAHDGSEEVEAAFAEFGEGGSPTRRITEQTEKRVDRSQYRVEPIAGSVRSVGDTGSASRFFYSSKAGPADRFGSKHPTVKPVDLMRWLARLITPPGGLILDPFAGSGSTGIAAIAEGFRAILIEADPEHQADIREHLTWATGKGRHSLSSKARNKEGAKHDDLPLFLKAD